MPIRIAINGFGRIGRCALKLALENPKLEIVAVNDLSPAPVLAHLLKYDSVYGPFDKEVGSEGGLSEKEHFPTTGAGFLMVAGRQIVVLAEKDPLKLPWKDLKVDVVLECTGRFTKKEEVSLHLQAGARRVILSSPGKDGVPTFLFGVNEDDYREETVVSNASCTTNCISPVAGILEEKFGIQKAMMTTIHAYTAEQNLVDGAPPSLHKDLHRARAAGVNIVPTTTGAAKTTGEVIPGLAGIFDGLAVRVPVVCGSLSDFTLLLKKKVTVDEVNKAFIEAAESARYRKIVAVSPEPLVSTDIIKNPHSAIVDLSLTRVVDGDLVKVVAWYDNEWGYSNRLVELAVLVGAQ
ncbi:MAG: type I glyceraldehyde-3-phosphate dehydrogenase [Patescibacteria group bacterium]